MLEDLRRIQRISVCCRAVVRDRYGLWTGVTDDVCARGCQIVTDRLLRVGSLVHVTLSSDLFPEELEARAEVVWSTPDRLGLIFLESDPRERKGIAPDAWMEKVLEHGAVPGSAASERVVPFVQRSGARAATTTSARNGRLVRTVSPVEPGPRARRA